MSPALAGRFLTTAPPGKPKTVFFWMKYLTLIFMKFFRCIAEKVFFFPFLNQFTFVIRKYYVRYSYEFSLKKKKKDWNQVSQRLWKIEGLSVV